jgi:serine O-acetyltransferase
VFNNILSDLDVYAFRKGWPRYYWPLVLIVYPTTWPIVTYRFGFFVKHKVHSCVLRYPLFVLYFILKRFFEILMAIELSEDAVIGKGIYIAHTGGTIVAHGARIGDYPSFHQHVTIGGAGRGDFYGHPTIGSRVFFGAGCNVVGRITLGDDVAIGANAVVTKSSIDKAVLVGIPARVINYNGSEHFIHFRRG